VRWREQAFSRLSAGLSVDDELLGVSREKRLASHWLPEVRTGRELNQANRDNGALYFDRQRLATYHQTHAQAHDATLEAHDQPCDQELRVASLPLPLGVRSAAGEADRARTAPSAKHTDLAQRLELLRVRSLASTPVERAGAIEDGHIYHIRPMRAATVGTALARRKKPRWSQVPRQEEPRDGAPVAFSGEIETEVLLHDITLRR
jgi:hypothetical protein